MTIPRHNPKRDANEPEIVAALRKAGASVYRLDTPADLLVGFRKTTFLAEVKMPKGTLTPDQQEFKDTWRGAPVYVIRTPQDAIDMLNGGA